MPACRCTPSTLSGSFVHPMSHDLVQLHGLTTQQWVVLPCALCSQHAGNPACSCHPTRRHDSHCCLRIHRPREVPTADLAGRARAVRMQAEAAPQLPRPQLAISTLEARQASHGQASTNPGLPTGTGLSQPNRVDSLATGPPPWSLWVSGDGGPVFVHPAHSKSVRPC